MRAGQTATRLPSERGGVRTEDFMWGCAPFSAASRLTRGVSDLRWTLRSLLNKNGAAVASAACFMRVVRRSDQVEAPLPKLREGRKFCVPLGGPWSICSNTEHTEELI